MPGFYWPAQCPVFWCRTNRFREALRDCICGQSACVCVTTFGGIFDKCSVNHARATWIAATRCRARATVLLSRRNDRQSQLNYKFSHSLCSAESRDLQRHALIMQNPSPPLPYMNGEEHTHATHTHTLRGRSRRDLARTGGGGMCSATAGACACVVICSPPLCRARISRELPVNIYYYTKARACVVR